MSRYQIGDKVTPRLSLRPSSRRLADCHYPEDMDKWIDRVGTVVEVMQDRAYVCFNDSSRVYGDCWYYMDQWLELVEEEGVAFEDPLASAENIISPPLADLLDTPTLMPVVTPNFKVNDRVKVVARCEQSPLFCWVRSMDASVGATLTVERVSEVGLGSGCYQYQLSNGWWYLPQSLELSVDLVPHKHHDLIIAWAKGHKIEVRGPSGNWFDVTSFVTWDGNAEYRLADNYAH